MKGRPCTVPECREKYGELEWVPMVGTHSRAPKPLNPEPSESGNIRITTFANGTQEGRFLDTEERLWARRQGELLYTLHSSVCPGEMKFRERAQILRSTTTGAATR